MSYKALKDILGKFGENSPEGERKFANLHGPVRVHNTPGQTSDFADDVEQATADGKDKKHGHTPPPKDEKAYSKVNEEVELDEGKDHVITSVDYIGSSSTKSKHQRKFGVKIMKNASQSAPYEHTVAGPREHVKKFLKHHYYGDEQEAKDIHPEVYNNNVKESLAPFEIKVRKGANGKYAPFRVFRDGKAQKVGNWYSDIADARMAAGLKEGFVDFVSEPELIEDYEDIELDESLSKGDKVKIYNPGSPHHGKTGVITTAKPREKGTITVRHEDGTTGRHPGSCVIKEEVEELDEDCSARFAEHHAKALEHVADIHKAINRHKRAITKGDRSPYHWDAEEMKHLARRLEDMKDELNNKADNAENHNNAIATKGY